MMTVSYFNSSTIEFYLLFISTTDVSISLPARLLAQEDVGIVPVCANLATYSSLQRNVEVTFDVTPGSAIGML